MTGNPCETCTRDCREEGCNAWRRWFVKNWNKNICVKPEPATREVFQYERPDRAREMAMQTEANHAE
jgi:hypothetical protein